MKPFTSLLQRNYEVPRISQLEAISLDQELASLFFEQFTKAWRFFKFDPYSHQAGVTSVCLALLLLLGHGARVQGFWYATPSFVRRCVGTLSLLAVPYVLRQTRWRMVEAVWACTQLLNTCVFVVYGDHPTLVHRVSKMRARPLGSAGSRHVSHAFMYRQLLWSSITDTLNLILPFLPKWITFVQPYIPSRPRWPASVCGVCGSAPTVPVHALPCMCLYCYVCSHGKQVCGRCRANVTEYRRV